MAEGKSPEGKASSGFTVTDRRSFAERGESAAAVAEPLLPASPGTAATSDPALGTEAVDFHTFILSLGSSALLHLGELDQPGGDPSTPDLPLAKHTIDIIAMLEQKTRGNLTSAEAHLIESLLFDLRLRYVERSSSKT
jgi:hypothetical protein